MNTSDLAVCYDCLHYFVNDEGEPVPLPDYLDHITLGTSVEGYFNTNACDTCSTPLAGERFDMTGWLKG